jgi:Fur family peroxide stress response transcriptional regulator
MRMTPQRAAICKALAVSDAHPTASMIYESIRAEYPSLSLMTVYNTLNVLVDLGVVNALGHAGDDKVHYDADTEPHINLACVSCHQITDIPSEHVGQLQGEISAASGYKLFGARVLYYGLCPVCQSRSRN